MRTPFSLPVIQPPLALCPAPGALAAVTGSGNDGFSSAVPHLVWRLHADCPLCCTFGFLEADGCGRQAGRPPGSPPPPEWEPFGEYQTRCVYGGCCVDCFRYFRGTCCWRLRCCPQLHLTLQKGFGQCSHMQNWDWCATICHRSACTGCMCVWGGGGGLTPCHTSSCNLLQGAVFTRASKGRPFPREGVPIPDAVRARCVRAGPRTALCSTGDSNRNQGTVRRPLSCSHTPSGPRTIGGSGSLMCARARAWRVYSRGQVRVAWG